MWVKSEPNEHEKILFQRAQQYIKKISWIPWIRMIAAGNSLSMYATHKDSDIDLFIITAKNRIWIVRALITFCFWLYGVWRNGDDIAENFCLSFFIDEDALDLSKIAIDDDIYLYFWIFYLKPIYTVENMYERFLIENPWVQVPHDIQSQNHRYTLPYKPSCHECSFVFYPILWLLNTGISCIWGWKARSSYKKKGSPFGVIIEPNMLKFHDKDRRMYIRENILHNR